MLKEATMKEITYAQATNEAVDEEMKRDTSIVIIGKAIGNPWVAAMDVLKGVCET